jgi:hypothetical protein
MGIEGGDVWVVGGGGRRGWWGDVMRIALVDVRIYEGMSARYMCL